MCGLNFLPWADAELPHLMNNTIAHRGLPGRHGVEVLSKTASFGHVRLPIQGLDARFDQPYKHGPLTIVFVGEIFNFKQLDPDAESDVEVLAESWLESGSRCLKNFDGFWAIAVHDARSGTVEIVTDFLGKKPLYKHVPSGAVSSEIRALRLIEAKPMLPDEVYFSNVQKWGYSPDERTPFKNIHRIPPRTSMIYDSVGSITSTIYDELQPDPGVDLRWAMETAVKNRLVSDVPVSVLWSGGLDSTIVLALALQENPDILVLHAENNEAEFLKYFPRAKNVWCVPAGDTTDLASILRANEGPVDLGSVIPQYHLARAIAGAGCHVALSGDGADELFGGYRRSVDYDSQASDIEMELVGYHLPRLDKLMMSQTIELRCPFLSRPIVECAMAMPYHKRVGKAVLRATFADLVPPEILFRPKFPLKSKEVLDKGLVHSRNLVEFYRTMEKL